MAEREERYKVNKEEELAQENRAIQQSLIRTLSYHGWPHTFKAEIQ